MTLCNPLQHLATRFAATATADVLAELANKPL